MPFDCKECGETFSSHLHSLSRRHKNKCCTEIADGIQIVKTAFKNRLTTYRIFSKKYPTDVELYLNDLKPKFVSLLKNSLLNHTNVKVNMELYGAYLLPSDESQDIKSFNSRYSIVSMQTDLDELFNVFQQVLVSKSCRFREKNSGWALSKLLFLELNINKHNVL